MQKFKIASLSLADIEKIVTMQERSGSSFFWEDTRAEVSQIESDRPVLSIECSREYNERLEAATILKLFKQIVALQIH
jgi:hypothetical protein